MFLLKEIEVIYPFMLKAVQGMPYPLFICYKLLSFY